MDIPGPTLVQIVGMVGIERTVGVRGSVGGFVGVGNSLDRLRRLRQASLTLQGWQEELHAAKVAAGGNLDSFVADLMWEARNTGQMIEDAFCVEVGHLGDSFASLLQAYPEAAKHLDDE